MSTITTHSRNSSTSSLNKGLPPPPSPIKHAPNAHPYAIKTTSSALTSHTTSSLAHAQAYKHFVPPPSPGSVPPSPSRSRTSSLVGGEGGGRHSYSRSMTEDGPKALPMTPDMERSGSASPSKGEYLELEGGSPRKSRFLHLPDDDEAFFGTGTVKSMRTPRQSGAMKRAETLPSSATAPFVFPTPSSIRSPGRLRSDSQSSNSDADDTGVHFASNSHSYRHSHTRSHEETTSLNKFASMRRSNGTRVRGMVESFERSASSSSGSELDGEVTTRSRSNSPTKRTSGGTLPTRPRMADIFSPAPTSSSPERLSDPFDAPHTTLKPSSHRTSKELPRLLPYPPPLSASFFAPPPPQPQPQALVHHPTGGPHAPLEQMHTGAAYPLPMSPEHTGGIVVASEIGMGYRPASSTARLLPIPPDLVPSPAPLMPSPEQVLHHPRPRKGGPPELVSVKNLEGDDAEGEGQEELSMEELLAKEGVGAQKTGKRHAKTGVHAWDVDAGETVKRALPSGPRPLSSNRTKTPLKKLSPAARSASPNEDGSPVEADEEGDGHEGVSTTNGFVNSRRGRRARGLKPKARPSQDSLSDGGNTKKYGDAGSQTDSDHEPSESFADAKSALDTRAKELDARTAELSLLSIEIEETQRELEATQVSLAARSAEIDGCMLVLSERASGLEEKALDLERRKAELEDRKAGLDAREAELESKAVEVTDAQAAVAAERVDAETRVEAVALREAVCLEREKALADRTQAVEARERELEVRADAMRESLEESARDIEEMEREVVEREDVLKKGREDVEARERALGDKERSVEVREGRVKALEEMLGARETGIKEKENDLAMREPVLAEKELAFQVREKELKVKEATFKKAADALKAKEAKVNARDAGLEAQETTSTLATRLLKRVAGPVFGDGVVGYITRPLGMSPEEYLAESSTSEAASSHSQASSSASSEPGIVVPVGDANVKQRPAQPQPKFTDVWAGIRPLLGRSPYFLVLGLGVCAIMLRVLAKGVSRGGLGGVVRGVAAVGGGVGRAKG